MLHAVTPLSFYTLLVVSNKLVTVRRTGIGNLSGSCDAAIKLHIVSSIPATHSLLGSGWSSLGWSRQVSNYARVSPDGVGGAKGGGAGLQF